jgi:hypothetical protein
MLIVSKQSLKQLNTMDAIRKVKYELYLEIGLVVTKICRSRIFVCEPRNLPVYSIHTVTKLHAHISTYMYFKTMPVITLLVLFYGVRN